MNRPDAPSEKRPSRALSHDYHLGGMPVEFIRGKKTSGAAFTLACDASGLEDKEIALPMGIDGGYFSGIKKGRATLQADLHRQFAHVVGNRIYSEWLAFQVGCTLTIIQTETERRLAETIEHAMQLQAENDLLRRMLRGKP